MPELTKTNDPGGRVWRRLAIRRQINNLNEHISIVTGQLGYVGEVIVGALKMLLETEYAGAACAMTEEEHLLEKKCREQGFVVRLRPEDPG